MIEPVQYSNGIMTEFDEITISYDSFQLASICMDRKIIYYPWLGCGRTLESVIKKAIWWRLLVFLCVHFFSLFYTFTPVNRCSVLRVFVFAVIIRMASSPPSTSMFSQNIQRQSVWKICNKTELLWVMAR